MNAVYEKYIRRNPSFIEKKGQVSIIAHSLGSVIIHDVLTLWNSHLMKEQEKNADPRVASGKSERYSTVQFGVVHISRNQGEGRGILENAYHWVNQGRRKRGPPPPLFFPKKRKKRREKKKEIKERRDKKETKEACIIKRILDLRCFYPTNVYV